MLYQIVKEVYTNYVENDWLGISMLHIVNRELGIVNPIIVIIIST